MSKSEAGALSYSNGSLRFLELFMFLLSIGEGLTSPAIPLLGQKLGASYSYIGFFMTGYAFAYAIMAVLSGRISDFIGRKKLLLFSLVIAVIASSGYYFASSALSLLIFRTLEGMSRGILWPAAEAIIADNTSLKGRDLAAGRFSAAYGGGVAVGNVIGGYLMQFAGIKFVFPFYPILIVVTFGLTLKFLVEGPHHLTRDKDSGTGSIVTPTSSIRNEIKKIWPVCYVGFAYSGFLYSLSGLLSLVASHYQVSYLGIGLIFALFWCMRLVAFVGAGRVSGLINRKYVLVFGISLATIAAAIFVLAQRFEFLVIASVIGGIGTGIMFPLGIALVADSASEGFHGFAMGFMELSASIGMIIQTALAGILAQWGGVQYTYIFAFIVCLAAVPVALFLIQDHVKLESGEVRTSFES